MPDEPLDESFEEWRPFDVPLQDDEPVAVDPFPYDIFKHIEEDKDYLTRKL